MEDLKIIIGCPQCEQLIRIPANKHIRFFCPNCKTKFEYKDGEQVTTPPIEVKPRSANTYSLIVLVLLVSLGLVVYALSVDQPRRLSDGLDNAVPSTAESPQPSAPESTFISGTSQSPSVVDMRVNSQSPEDSIFAEKLKELLEDMGKDRLEELCDFLKEEAEKGHWEKANVWYDKSVSAIEQSGKKGDDFLTRNEQKLASTKTDIVKHNPNKPSLPNAEIINPNAIETEIAYEQVYNSTPYTLTLYYSGPINKIIKIPSMENSQVLLPKGTYNIVAKVSVIGIKESFGTRSIGGFKFGVRYVLRPLIVPFPGIR
jgi:hypothetical protein